MSVFATAKARPFVLSLAFLEALNDVIAADGEQTLGQAVIKAGLSLYGKPALSKTQIEYIGDRLAQINKAPAEAESSTAKRSLGSDFMAWSAGLAPDRLCLYLADNDWDRAHTYYYQRDCDDIKAMAALRAEYEWHAVQAAFEAALFGFGGSYDEDGAQGQAKPQGKTFTYDLRAGDEEAAAKLDSMLKL